MKSVNFNNMKTKHNPNIKKLSTAIRRGYKIAQENGIKVSRDSLIEFKYEGNKRVGIDCACSLGLGLIGLYGTDPKAYKTNQDGYARLNKAFGSKNSDKSECLLKTAPNSKHVKESFDIDGKLSVHDFVIALNDGAKMNPEKIAEKLEKCKL